MHPASRQKSGNQAKLSARNRHILLIAAAMTSLFVVRSAQAEPEMTPFEEAVAHFKAGEYARAAPAFHIAYSRDSKPVLLYNAALSEQRSDQLDLAQRDYKRVLSRTDLHPKIAERARAGLAEVEAAIAARANPSTGAVETQPKAAAAATPAPTPAPTAAPPSVPPAPASAKPATAPVDAAVDAGSAGNWQGTAGWAGVGIGAVLTGVGGWLLASWSADEAAFLKGLERKDGKVTNLSNEAFRSKWDELGGQHNLALATTISGVVFAGAGVWLLLTAPSPNTPNTLTLRPTGRGAALCLRF